MSKYKYAKSFSEIIKLNEENSDTKKRWNTNTLLLKDNYIIQIEKKNFLFYFIVLIVSIVLVCLCLNNYFSNMNNNLLISLSCSFISGIIVSFFLEHNSNKKWILSTINKYNYDLCRIYFPMQEITGYVFFSDFILRNYIFNEYIKENSINIEYSLQMEEILKKEVLDKFNNDVNQIPFAKEYASTHISAFIQKINSIISSTNSFLITYHSYLTIEQIERLSNILYEAERHLDLLQNYERKIFVIDVNTFDTIIQWAQDNATSDFVNSFYMRSNPVCKILNNLRKTNHSVSPDLKDVQ